MPASSSRSLPSSRSALQASDLSIEVALLLEVRGHSGCSSIGLKCSGRLAGLFEEVAADRVEATIGVDPGVGGETVEQFETGSRPGDHADGDGVVEGQDRVVV